MLDQVLAAVQLRKELPDAIGYDTYGPIKYPTIPVELNDSLSKGIREKLQHLTSLGLYIDNCSSKVQKNVRILFSGEYQFSPRISFRRRTVEVKYEVHEEDKEILILEIPPNESVLVEIFNADQNFKIQQVLINGSEVTRLMQKLAEAKRYPKLARTKYFAIAAFALMIGSVFATGYITWERIRESNIIKGAHEGFASCSPYVFDNPPEKEKALERKFNQLGFWSNFVLQLNKVDSLDKLKLKDQVILCEPYSPQ